MDLQAKSGTMSKAASYYLYNTTSRCAAGSVVLVPGLTGAFQQDEAQPSVNSPTHSYSAAAASAWHITGVLAATVPPPAFRDPNQPTSPARSSDTNSNPTAASAAALKQDAPPDQSSNGRNGHGRLPSLSGGSGKIRVEDIMKAGVAGTVNSTLPSFFNGASSESDSTRLPLIKVRPFT
jgi:hypothetical protein